MDLFSGMVNSIWLTTLLILFIVLVLITINIISDFKNYGSKLFTSFKRYDTTGKLKNLVIDILRKELKKDVLIFDRNDNYFIAITKYGTFSIQLTTTYDGLFKNRKINEKDHYEIMSQFLNDKLKLDEDNMDIDYILIKDSQDFNFNFAKTGVKDVISIGEFSHKVYSMQHSKVMYTHEDVNNIYNRLGVLLNGNNKN